MSQLIDTFGRAHNNLRVSVTDRCNLRCTYCMPEDVVFRDRSELLTFEEITHFVRVAAGVGIDKVRLTGGTIDGTAFVDPVARRPKLGNARILGGTVREALAAAVERRMMEAFDVWAANRGRARAMIGPGAVDLIIGAWLIVYALFLTGTATYSWTLLLLGALLTIGAGYNVLAASRGGTIRRRGVLGRLFS